MLNGKQERNQGTTWPSCYHLQLRSDPALQERVCSQIGWNEMVHIQRYPQVCPVRPALKLFSFLEPYLWKATFHILVSIKEPKYNFSLKRQREHAKGSACRLGRCMNPCPSPHPPKHSVSPIHHQCSSGLEFFFSFTCEVRCSSIVSHNVKLSRSSEISHEISNLTKNKWEPTVLGPLVPGLGGAQKNFQSNKTWHWSFHQKNFYKEFHHEILNCQ